MQYSLLESLISHALQTQQDCLDPMMGGNSYEGADLCQLGSFCFSDLDMDTLEFLNMEEGGSVSGEIACGDPFGSPPPLGADNIPKNATGDLEEEEIPIQVEVSNLQESLTSMPAELQQKLVENLVSVGATQNVPQPQPPSVALPLASAALGAFLTRYARSHTPLPEEATPQGSQRKAVAARA